MAECGPDRKVLALWSQAGVFSSRQKEALEELLYTDFGPIVKYFRCELEECEISILEGALEKYFFPWSFRLPYPDRTYCGRCSDDGHLTACVGQLRTRLYQKTTRDFYHFTTPPGRPSNM